MSYMTTMESTRPINGSDLTGCDLTKCSFKAESDCPDPLMTHPNPIRFIWISVPQILSDLFSWKKELSLMQQQFFFPSSQINSHKQYPNGFLI